MHTPTLPFLQYFQWAFVRMDPVNVPAKFEVRNLTCSGDNKGYPKNWAVLAYAHAAFSPKFLMGFFRMDPVNVLAKFEVRTRS